MLRRTLLGGLGVLAACCAVAAAPPGLQPRPHVEGRELDPVTRDHYLPDVPLAGATPDASPSAAGESAAFWAALLGAHAAITDEFTMPLGTVAPAGM
ncbi:MAG: hypothetical protein ACKODX_14310 [Gemmata sp.]